MIPEGFTEQVLAGKQQILRLERAEGANQEFDLAAQAHIIRAIGRVLARLVEMSEEGTAAGPERKETSGETGAGAGGVGALAGNSRAGAGGARAEVSLEEYRAFARRPQLVTLAVTTAGAGRPVPSGFAQSVPGILTMMVLMMTLIYGAVFLTLEKRDGMLRRQVSLPLSRGQIYGGKLAGRLAVAGVQIVLLVLAGRFIFGVSFGSSPAGLALVLISYAVAVAGLATMLGSLLRTPEQASAVGWISSSFMAGLGGCWWPSEVMPLWLWTAAHMLPTAWAMEALHQIVSFGRGADAVLLPSTVLLGFGALFAGIGARFLRFTES